MNDTVANTEATTRTVSVKPFAISINGQTFNVRAKTKTAAINAALEQLNIEAVQLTADDVLDRGLTADSFISA